MHPGSWALRLLVGLLSVLWVGVLPLWGIEEEEILAGPYLTNLRPNHVTVSFKVNRPLLGWVLYDTEGHFDSGWNYTHGYPPEDVLADLHHVTLPGLLDDERYYYTITLKDPNDDRDYGFFDYSFKTPPEKGQAGVNFRIGAYGDCYGNPELLRVVSDEIGSETDMIAAFLLGDILPPEPTEASWREFFYGVEFLGAEKAIFPMKGEHESTPQASLAFDRYFPLIEAPLEAQRPFTYHSFDWGVVHLIVLDTLNMDEAQINWLENDLQALSSAPYILVFMHEPLEGMTQALSGRLQEIFTRNRVSVVFAGGDGDFRLQERSLVWYANMGPLTRPIEGPVPPQGEGGGLILRNAIPYVSFQVNEEGDVWLEVISMGSLSPDGSPQMNRRSVQRFELAPRTTVIQ